MKFLLISGKKFSGKDTLSKFLTNNNWLSLAYADTLKDALKILFNWDHTSFDHNNKEIIDPEWNTSPRVMCQLLGTEFLREKCSFLNTTIYHPTTNEPFQASFHIKRIHQKILKILKNSPNSNIVITDGRFPDEIDYVRWLGGKCIRIERPSISENEYSNHESEKYIDNLYYDHIIVNDSSIDNLHNKLKDFLEKND